MGGKFGGVVGGGVNEPAGAVAVTSKTFEPMRAGVRRRLDVQPLLAATDRPSGASAPLATAAPAVPAALTGGNSVITAAAKITAAVPSTREPMRFITRLTHCTLVVLCTVVVQAVMLFVMLFLRPAAVCPLKVNAEGR